MRDERASTGSTEGERKRQFLDTFERWDRLFKRADRGDVQAEKWLIAEYFDSLGHLSPEGLDVLTRELKARCTFFPTIRECLEIINPPRYSYASPFYAAPAMFRPREQPLRLGDVTTVRRLRHEGQP